MKRKKKQQEETGCPLPQSIRKRRILGEKRVLCKRYAKVCISWERSYERVNPFLWRTMHLWNLLPTPFREGLSRRSPWISHKANHTIPGMNKTRIDLAWNHLPPPPPPAIVVVARVNQPPPLFLLTQRGWMAFFWARRSDRRTQKSNSKQKVLHRFRVRRLVGLHQ